MGKLQKFVLIILSFILLVEFTIYKILQYRNHVTGVQTNSTSTQNHTVVSFNVLQNFMDIGNTSNNKSPLHTYTLIATGDVIPARSINAKLIQLSNFNYPFEDTVDVLHSADMVFINLEAPLVPGCQPTQEGMRFCGDPRFISALKYAGITIASIANNHVGNYGLEGIHSTVNLLKQSGIQVTGDSINNAIITIRGKTFGFLGYNDIGIPEAGIPWADIPTIKSQVGKMKTIADFVIVTFHWGTEYTQVPNERQVNLAHNAVDAGADLVIGNHPHWIQGVEKYKGKYITYAHGNYIFDQMWSVKTREGLLGKYTFDDTGVIDTEFIPIVIDDYAHTRRATSEEAARILTDFTNSSETITHLIK